MDTIGQRLKELIDKKGLTLLEFSEKVGIQRSSLSHLFSGRNKPSIDLLLKIKKQFPDTDLEWLITGESIGSVDSTAQKEKEINLTDDKSDVTYVNSANDSIDNQNIKSPKQSQSSTVNPTNEIERIVIFYKNGKFTEYNNHQ